MDDEFFDEPLKDQSGPRAERLSNLRRTQQDRPVEIKRYSAFIHSMRIVLPLVALSLMAAVFAWNSFTPDTIAPARPNPQEDQKIGKNELLNPKFESLDDKNQPYTITATRAVQNPDDELMLLDGPMADIFLENGHWLAIKSLEGEYKQESRKLLLKKDVSLYHDDGYTAKTQELNVDMESNTAQTELAVKAYGPAGTLNATGMNADSNAGTLIFTGPAKLVLYDTGNQESAILRP